jgi:hypothetical protein
MYKKKCFTLFLFFFFVGKLVFSQEEFKLYFYVSAQATDTINFKKVYESKIHSQIFFGALSYNDYRTIPANIKKRFINYICLKKNLKVDYLAHNYFMSSNLNEVKQQQKSEIKQLRKNGYKVRFVKNFKIENISEKPKGD